MQSLELCLDADVLNTALVAIHNVRCNPLPEPTKNRLVVLKIEPQKLFVHCIIGIFLFSSRWCLVAYLTIRNEFPEESGEYAGFKPAEIDLN